MGGAFCALEKCGENLGGNRGWGGALLRYRVGVLSGEDDGCVAVRAVRL
jgi:hypothetical protein